MSRINSGGSAEAQTHVPSGLFPGEFSWHSFVYIRNPSNIFVSWIEAPVPKITLNNQHIMQQPTVTRLPFMCHFLSANSVKEINEMRSLYSNKNNQKFLHSPIWPLNTSLQELVIAITNSFNECHTLLSTVLVSHTFFFIFGCVSVVASAIHKQLVISKHKAATVEKRRPFCGSAVM